MISIALLGIFVLLSCFCTKKFIFAEYDCFKKNPKKERLIFQAFYIGSILPLIIIFIFSFVYFEFCVSEEKTLCAIYLYFKFCMNWIVKSSNFSNMLHLISFLYGSTFIVLWNLRKTYEDKWKYAASMFNQLALMEVNSEEDWLKKENYIACLLIDLYEMELQFHESFKDLVRNKRFGKGKEISRYQSKIVEKINKIQEQHEVKI